MMNILNLVIAFRAVGKVSLSQVTLNWATGLEAGLSLNFFTHL